MPLAISIRDQKTCFSPGERVSGQVSWQLETPPTSAELRLVWSTSGRGDSDAGMADSTVFSAPQSTETRPFSFTLPDGPYSFSGKLISLTWALELAIEPGNQIEGVEITLGPDGRAVALPRGVPGR